MKVTKNDNLISSIFKINLRKFRKKRGYSLKDLSDKTGISIRMLSYYENHISNLPLAKLIKIANSLNVSVSKLLGFNSNDNNSKKSKKNTNDNIDFETIDTRTLQKIRKLLSLSSQDRVLIYSLIDSIYYTKINKKEKN